MNPKLQQSFTLIELLVVISILGLLSSLVLLGLQGAEDQANQKKAMEFSHTVRVSLGVDLVGEWRFDDGVGTTTRDNSGLDNDGTLGNGACTPGNGACPTWIDDGIFGKALVFDGINDYVIAPNSSDLKFSNDKDFTISLWVYAENTGQILSSTSDCGQDEVGFSIWQSGGFLCLQVGDGSQYPAGTDKRINTGVNIINEQWHYIVLAGDRNGLMTAYVDGENAGSVDISGEGNIDHYPFNFGREGSNRRFFRGTIDEVRIYNQALPSAEIQKLYVRGTIKYSNN